MNTRTKISEVKPCKCKNEYQDQKYGKGMRVHNKARDRQGEFTVNRCTVCNTER